MEFRAALAASTGVAIESRRLWWSCEHQPRTEEPSTTKTTMPLIDLLQRRDEGDFLRAVTEAVLRTLMEHDIEGLVGAGRYERGESRQSVEHAVRHGPPGGCAYLTVKRNQARSSARKVERTKGSYRRERASN